jgi:hypothetical protein
MGICFTRCTGAYLLISSPPLLDILLFDSGAWPYCNKGKSRFSVSAIVSTISVELTVI